MARPLKQGLDYFPLDTDFLQDIKVRRLIRACGSSAIPMLIGLLVNIYRGDGYYLRWDSDMTFLISDEVGISEGAAQEFINKAVQVGFFDKKLYEKKNILTSAGIQRRFFEITKRRKSVFYDDTLLLIDVNEYTNLVNVNNNPVNVYHNQQSKGKESKGKESKEEERKNNSFPSSASKVIKLYRDNIHPVNSAIERDKLVALIEDHGESFVQKAIERAVMRNKRSLAYITGILSRWETNGYDEGSNGDGKKRPEATEKSEEYLAFLERRKAYKAKQKQKGVTADVNRREHELPQGRAEAVISEPADGRKELGHILDDV